MSVKLTVVYDNPKDPAEFEEQYKSVHIPLAMKIPNVTRAELAKVFPKEDGSPTPAYRTADFYFDSYDVACAAAGSPEGQPQSRMRCASAPAACAFCSPTSRRSRSS